MEMKKAEIQDILSGKGVDFEKKMTKKQLIQTFESYRSDLLASKSKPDIRESRAAPSDGSVHESDLFSKPIKRKAKDQV